MLTRARPRLVVARVLLALQGELPCRLMRFLEDAQDRGLLRQSGGVYRFRHIRSQERLATRPVSAGRAVAGPAPSRVSRRASRQLAVGLVVVLIGLLVMAAPDDQMRMPPQPERDVEQVAMNRTGTGRTAKRSAA